jgi:hypothetical protein
MIGSSKCVREPTVPRHPFLLLILEKHHQHISLYNYPVSSANRMTAVTSIEFFVYVSPCHSSLVDGSFLVVCNLRGLQLRATRPNFSTAPRPSLLCRFLLLRF